MSAEQLLEERVNDFAESHNVDGINTAEVLTDEKLAETFDNLIKKVNAKYGRFFGPGKAQKRTIDVPLRQDVAVRDDITARLLVNGASELSATVYRGMPDIDAEDEILVASIEESSQDFHVNTYNDFTDNRSGAADLIETAVREAEENGRL